MGYKLPRAPRRLGAPPSLKNKMYTRMSHFEPKKIKIFFSRECFPGPRGGSRRASAFVDKNTTEELTQFLFSAPAQFAITWTKSESPEATQLN